MAYKYKFMDEANLKEIEELLAGEHGTALTAWSYECAEAGIYGYIDGRRKCLITGSLIGAVGAAVAAGGFWVAKKLVKKRVDKQLADTEKDS